MADVHADLNAELRRRARAGSVTLDLAATGGRAVGTQNGDPLRAAAGASHEPDSGSQSDTLHDAYARLEDAQRTGDQDRIAEADWLMDRAVASWREGRAADRTDSARSTADRDPDFGAGAGRRRSVERQPTMSDRLRADAWGIDPRHVEAHRGGGL